MLKRLCSCIREYKIPTLLTPVFVALEVIMEVFIPYLMGRMIDDGIKKGDVSFVTKTGILLVIICLFSLFSGIAAGVTAAKASSGFAKNL